MAGKISAKERRLKKFKTLLLKKKKRGLEDLFFFNKYILESSEKRRKMLVPHVHGEWWDWFKKSKSRIKCMLVPRNTFKSTFFTVGWTIQQICQDRDARVLIANATLPNAQKFLSDIRMHLRKNETLKQLYGKFYDKDLTWNQDEIEVLGRSMGTREPTVSAIGSEGNLVSRHYSCIIADDLVNRENSATRYQSNKIIDWWKRSLSLLEPDGTMLVIGTRWSYYELYSYLLENYKDKLDFYVRSIYNPDGSLYFPERFGEEKVKELKDYHGSYIFSSFYLNDPVDDETALIKKSMIREYREGEQPKKLNIFAMCDPAVAQTAESDYSAIVVVGEDDNRNWWVRETRRGRWSVNQLIDQMFDIHKQWQPHSFTIETIGQAQSILQPIHDAEIERNIFLPLVAIKARNAVQKETRIRSVLQPRFERGKVYILPHMDELRDELLKFPKSAHDDMVDALSDCSEVCFNPPPPEEDKPKPSSYFESQLQENFKGRESEYYDDVMGEYF